VGILRGICTWLATLILSLALCLTPTALAVASADSPPDPSGVTLVNVDVWGLSIFNIDDRNATFEVEAHLNALWQDPRLAFDPGETGYELRVLEGESAAEALKSEIWSPGFEITNARRTRDIMRRSIEIDPDGWVFSEERFSVEVTQDYFLGNFPFDGHDISFSVGPWYYDNQRVIFQPFDEGETRGETVDWEPDEWAIGESQMYVANGWCSASDEVSCNVDSDCPATETCDGFAYATVELFIERVPKYYLTNIVLPMMLIVLISSAVFSMSFKTTHLGDRLGVSFTSVLTVVAFDFVTSERLPRLTYSTAMDHILTAGYLFLAVNVIQNVVAARANERDPAAAERLDRIFRWGFPLAYIAVVGGIVFNASLQY
jgi:hypothetical protein